VSEIMMKLLRISQYIEHADTSSIKLEPGKKVNDKMVYPRRVTGKFKYYPENNDVIEHVTHTFKNQLLELDSVFFLLILNMLSLSKSY
jgi:hypothetical protein